MRWTLAWFEVRILVVSSAVIHRRGGTFTICKIYGRSFLRSKDEVRDWFENLLSILKRATPPSLVINDQPLLRTRKTRGAFHYANIFRKFGRKIKFNGMLWFMYKFCSQSGPFWKWSSLTGWSSPTKTCHSISKKFLFPVLHVLCYAVIKILVEMQIDRFDSIGSFVSIQQYVPFFPW